MINITDPRRTLPRETDATAAQRRAAKAVAENGLFGGPARRAVGAFIDPRAQLDLRVTNGSDLVDISIAKRSADNEARIETERRVDNLHPAVAASEWVGQLPIDDMEVLDQVHRAWLRTGKQWFVMPPADIAGSLNRAPALVRASLDRLLLLGAISKRESFGTPPQWNSNLPMTRTANPVKY